ncbi:MAG: ABC transporter ATP-binding protein [Candidatus Binatia bacterium]
MASVRFERVGKRYSNGHYGVREIELEVADGELLVLVGPSGCGKSTLLRLLAGLETITEGHLYIDEHLVDSWSPQERNVAMVFQDYALYPFMTVRRNLAFPLQMRRLARGDIDERVERAAAMLELHSLLDRYPRELSGGQRQRVAMGRALVREPSVSLLDEPLSNLDAKLRIEVRAQIAALQERTGTTMLYVTHDQTEAMTLGHRIAVLDAGRLQQVAAPRELYDRPANLFVAGFIGNPPMNLLPGRVEVDGSTLHLAIAGQRVALLAPSWARALADRAADIRHIGIRPEAVGLRREPTGAELLTASVAHVEFLGHETLAHLALAADERVIGRFPGMQALEHGERIRLKIDSDQLHLFDAAGDAVPVTDPLLHLAEQRR